MNKHIRELADEADSYAKQTVHYYMGQFDGLTWEGKIKQTRDQKFAELIVQECMSCASFIGITNSATGLGPMPIRYTAMVNNQIRKHSKSPEIKHRK
jgi:hypothetical protein